MLWFLLLLLLAEPSYALKEDGNAVQAQRAVEDDTNVRYVHLALTGSPTEMNVGWYTQSGTQTSTVEYNPEGGSTSVATGAAKEWLAGYGFNHFVTLTDLRPATVYTFRCGDAAGGWSALSTFTTAPGDTAKAFAVAIYGDMGIENSQQTADALNKRALNDQFDFVYHVGDISYADDHVFAFQNTWNTWFSMVENTTARKPYMVLPGNHEYTSWDPFLFLHTHNFVVYNSRFMMPGSASAERKNMYYSFDYGNVHFISMSTETSFPEAPFGNDFGDQLAWLEADLIKANENRKTRPWIIVGGHRPIYCSTQGFSDENGNPTNNWIPLGGSNSKTLQTRFEDLFMKYKVDVIFTGHVHSYERNYPTYQSQILGDYSNPKAPIGIIVGNAGSIEGIDSGKWVTPAPQWSAFRWRDGFGLGLLKVDQLTLKWEFYSANNSLVDSVTINKNAF